MATGLAIYLVSVLGLLGLSQWLWLRRRDAQLRRDLDDAEDQGLHQALTQHPHVNLSRCIGCGCCVRACPEKRVLTLHRGKATLLLGAHCVGHGLCEQSCPMGAISVGLGDTSQRTDVPVLSEDLETSVPGIFIAGELGGIGLIRHAVKQGVRVGEVIARRLRRSRASVGGENPLDVLVVGCGPAGIAAALKARQQGLSVAVVDGAGLGGTVSRYPKNKLTLTHPVTLPVYGRLRRSQYTREELIAIWEAAFAKAKLNVQGGTLFREVHVAPDHTLHAVTTAGVIHCRHLILALGRRGTPRRLGVPGEKATHVHYRLEDPQAVQHQRILVVGGGDSAVEAACSLSEQPGNHVTLSYRRAAIFRIKPFNRERLAACVRSGSLEVLYRSHVQEILPDHVQLTVQAADEDSPPVIRTVPAERIYVLAGGVPPYDMLRKIGVRFGGDADRETQTEGSHVA